MPPSPRQVKQKTNSRDPHGDDARTDRLLTSREQAQRDAELVRRFRDDGDPEAFTQIVTQYREKMYAVALGVLRNAADAKEIAQDTFIRAHRGLANFRGESSLATWLHHITLNLARNRYWYFHRRRRHDTLSLDCALSDESQSTLADVVAADAPDPARAATHEEFSELITTCMGQLAAPQREILMLRNLMHSSYEDISRALGINVGTVKSRIARARGNLRSLMTEACPEFEGAEASAWLESASPANHSMMRCA